MMEMLEMQFITVRTAISVFVRTVVIVRSEFCIFVRNAKVLILNAGSITQETKNYLFAKTVAL
jgi:hypothetical protein